MWIVQKVREVLECLQFSVSKWGSYPISLCNALLCTGEGWGGGPPREDNTVYLTLASRIHEGRDGRKEKYGRKKIKKVDKKLESKR